MLIQIKLRDPGSAYSDNGKAISGGDPIIVELTPFICGLIYRKEADIFEDVTDKLNNGEHEDISKLPWFDLKKAAEEQGINTIGKPKKVIVEMLKGKINELQREQ